MRRAAICASAVGLGFVVLAPLAACRSGAAAESTCIDRGVSAAPSGYDAALASRLGADEYGMRPYVIAFLRAGPTRDQDPETVQRLQRAHLDNINRLAAEGTLVLAGPFVDDGELRGIYVFDVASVEEARALTASDPAVQAGRLAMELHPWYGSAAIREINAIHGRIAATNP